MPTLSPELRRRVGGAVFAVALQALLAWGLLSGLSVRFVPRVEEALKAFDVAPVPPPRVPRPVPVRTAARRQSGTAAPAHARATPTPVVAPAPVIVLPPPPPLVVAAPVVAFGADAAAGAADRGEGTGAGGEGTGRGSGAGGTGTGSGGTPAELIRANINGYRDYPRALREAGIEGVLTTRNTVDRRGRVVDCQVTASSGNAVLDATTCRLVIERYRYAPARDGSGRPVSDVVVEQHHWGIRDEPQPDGPTRDDRP